MPKTTVVVLEDNFDKAHLTGEMLMEGAKAGGHVIEAAAKLNASGGRPGLRVRTGALVNSITVVKGKSTKTRAEVAIGPSVIHARIHEYGGIIRPVTAQFLAIPLPGVTGRPRDYDLHVVPFGGMVAGLVDASGSVMFLLKKAVHIPARPYMRPAVDENEFAIKNAVWMEMQVQIMRAVPS